MDEERKLEIVEEAITAARHWKSLAIVTREVLFLLRDELQEKYPEENWAEKIMGYGEEVNAHLKKIKKMVEMKKRAELN